MTTPPPFPGSPEALEADRKITSKRHPVAADPDLTTKADNAAAKSSGRETFGAKANHYRLPPGLKRSLPFYAHKPWVKLGEPIRLFEHLKATYGSISCYKFLGTYIVYVNDPSYIREILVNRAGVMVKERTLQRMKILLGEGLITSDDPFHQRQRKLMAPAFHRQRIAGYADSIVTIAQASMDSWREGEVVDGNATMMKLSLDVIARTLFDTEVDDEIRSINDETNRIMGLYNFLVAFPQIERVLHLPIPGISTFRRSRARLDGIVGRMIATRRREMEDDPGRDRPDLLSLLVASRYEPDAEGEEAPTGMTDVQIRDEVVTIFLAGYETVANALTWTWYLLSQNPDAERQMHAELDAVLGTGNDRRAPSLQTYPQLRYTEQVFSEAMRLYPPAWAMGRKSTEIMELGTYRIPAGAHYFFSQYVMHRTPEYFPDPLRFDPDRFTPEAKAAREKYTYFPFGGGGRQCIGESFAWMEGVLILATIAQLWRLAFVGETAPVPQAKITLRPKGPVPMRLVRR